MKKSPFVLIAIVLLFAGCGEQGPVERSWGGMKGLDKIAGNMNDDSYSTGRTQEPRLN